jgi:hypothetical protein
MTGRTVQRHAGLDRVHVLPDGYRVKTLPSRLDACDLARLAASGARPAGPPPLPPATGGEVLEAGRTVNASGNVSLGSHIISAGLPLAGQRVTLRLDGPVARIRSGGILARTVARLRGGRAATAQPPRLPDPPLVSRRVSVRGAIMTGGQRIQAGLPHAGKPSRSPWNQRPARSPSNPASPSLRPAPPAAISGGTRPLTSTDARPGGCSGKV